MRSFTNRGTEYGVLSNNTTTSNIALGQRLMNDRDRYLINRFNFNETTSTVSTVASTQSYKLPFNCDKIIGVYVTVGTVRYTLKEVPSQDLWDKLNYVSYSSNIAEYYYVFGDYIYILPVPSSVNTMTIVYKTRIKDLSQADYTTGTVAVTNGSATVTGSGTTFTAAMVGRWLQVTAPSGDNEWYKITAYTSSTVITLFNPYNGITVAGASYTIGEMSLVQETFQNISFYYALMVYYASRVKDTEMFEMYKKLYEEGYKAMSEDLVNKTDNMVIDDGTGYQRLINPNFYITL